MKNAVLLIAFIFSLQTSFAQEYPKQSVVQFVEIAEHDAICEHPEIDCFRYDVTNVQIADEDIYAAVKASKQNSVVGPFYIYQIFSEDIGMRGGFFMFRKVKAIETYEVHASHILVEIVSQGQDTLAAYRKTKKLYEQIKKSASVKDTFEACAVKYGKDGTSASKGDLGWFGEGVMVKSFERPCFEAKSGDLFMVRTEFGYHIVYVHGKRPKQDMVIETQVYYLRKEGECFQGEPCWQK